MRKSCKPCLEAPGRPNNSLGKTGDRSLASLSIMPTFCCSIAGKLSMKLLAASFVGAAATLLFACTVFAADTKVNNKSICGLRNNTQDICQRQQSYHEALNSGFMPRKSSAHHPRELTSRPWYWVRRRGARSCSIRAMGSQ